MNASSMGLNYTLNKTQAETDSFCTSAFVCPVEPLKDSELITLRDTDPSVLDFYDYHVGFRMDSHRYESSFWCELYRVVKKISESLTQPDWICLKKHGCFCKILLQGYLLFFS